MIVSPWNLLIYVLGFFSAQCLYVLSESNSQLRSAMENAEVRSLLEAVIAKPHETAQQLLLKTLIAGQSLCVLLQCRRLMSMAESMKNKEYEKLYELLCGHCADMV